MRQFDTVVIGAGVVGVNIANRISRLFSSWKIAILERHEAPGTMTSALSIGCPSIPACIWHP